MTSTVTAEATTSASASSRQATPSAVPDASSTVRNYFAAINAQDYRRAWDLGGKNLSGSYAAFADGFAGTAHDALRILRSDGDTVSVRLETTQSDGSLRLYAGTYTVHEGVIAGADIREVTAPEPESSDGIPYYDNCAEVREAGAAPISKDEPGYGPHLDRDGDGVACEPYASHVP